MTLPLTKKGIFLAEFSLKSSVFFNLNAFCIKAQIWDLAISIIRNASARIY